MYSYEVPPRSRDNIIEAAVALRQALRITNPMFPILPVVEVLLPQYDPDFSFEVWEQNELGEQHGVTRPELKEMWIREDVYQGARQGVGRDRFTIAHELGHYLLHNEPGLARTMKPRGHCRHTGALSGKPTHLLERCSSLLTLHKRCVTLTQSPRPAE